MDPISKFEAWLEKARRHQGIIEPTAVALATAGKSGQPSLRMVLLKGVDARGFAFYTNMESHKARELKENPHAALCFYWMPLFRQVRVEGKVEKVSDADADAYFKSRPRESRIGAWASKQSAELPSMDILKHAVAEYEKKFEGQDVPRPPFWSGWRVIPERIEFWQQGEYRLHERELYIRQEHGWNVTKLYP